ncbi:MULTISPECIES: S9 family peptidase [unclassified Bosea (in: a-proteobacteria)]|uniref:S9 family peptidase n=1 Tax=unclassified Bosea (in: a-proteobacteria) TaxID=2653178 RepID=UPI000F765C78|nr:MULTISPECIES: S9 family peptidase [unclassified Bosea (in: a-proteobacteria)]AZO78663.1 S9 family peptidase [Bosea sp. Tri-49]RXT17549.1 S9 family peptidase [Bosea sp. Tri-39]RXT40921.1 S9 family peptidase [Bosea sp. Tri-54]
MTSQRRVSAQPVPAIRPQSSTVHGVVLTDDYAWLRAENWRDVLRDPDALPAEIRAHIEAENAWCDNLMAPTRTLQRELIKEMRGRIKEDDSEPPQPDGPFLYYSRYRRGGEHPLICRKSRSDKGGKPGREQVMLDTDALSEGKEFFDLGDAEHSPDHRLLAWSADEAGSELYLIRIRDLSTGKDLPDAIANTSGEMIWAADSSTFAYVALDDDHRPTRVLRHRLGTPQSEDELLYEETDPGLFADIDQTQSRRFLLISSSDHETSEVRLVDLADEAGKPKLIAARQPRRQYSVEHHGDELLILTNADGAEDFKIVRAPLADPSPSNWVDLVPHKRGRLVLSHLCLADRLIRLEREEGLPRIVIRDLKSGAESSIAFDEEAYGLGIDAGYEFDTDRLRFIYASMARPAETFDYDLATGERTFVKRQEVPSGHDPDAYVVRRIFATAKDGAKVPVSLLHRRDLVLDGSAPCLLYGYGSYGAAMSASFRTRPLSLVDRGFVYAIAHIRGGTDKGWGWYLDGKRQNKPNSFTDFIAAGEMLAAEGFTSRGRIVAEGGSAGGMLMGAVANLAPELFAGIIAEVPFVDVLNTILDESLPLTPMEWPEWGDPIRDEAAFRTILGYSPYDNVKAQAYPPILATGGLADPRVTYWEPAKWVARLRATMTGGGPVMLHTNMDAGHAGAAGRFDSLKETALAYAFAITAAAGGWDKASEPVSSS